MAIDKKYIGKVTESNLDDWLHSTGFLYPTNEIQLERFEKLYEDYDFKLHLELKNQNRWQVNTWFEQAESDCIEGKLPIVIMHRTQKNENGKRIAEADDFVFLRLKDFLDILDDGKIIKKCLDKKTKM